MENQINVSDQNTRQIGQNTVSQPVQVPEKPKINYWMISMLVLLLVFIGLFGALKVLQKVGVTTKPESLTTQGEKQKNQQAIPTKRQYQRFIYCTVSRFAEKYGGEYTTHVYVYDPDSKQEKEIISIPTTKAINLSRISISPDRKKIAYSIFEQTVPDTGAPYINKELWLVDVGSLKRTLVFSDKKEGSIIDYLTWSPDGSYLIFYNNSKEPYKYSVAESKNEKMNNFPGIIAGWFTNGKLGFEKADTSRCSGGECYNPNKALLTSLDGSESVEVYAPNKDEIYTPYYWLNNGSGFVRTKVNSIIRYDFESKKETEIIKTTTQNGRLGTITMFPKSNSALIAVWDGDTIIYRVDFDTNVSTKIKAYTGELTFSMDISDDEKYYLLQQINVYFGTETKIDLVSNDGNLIDQTGSKKDMQLFGFIE